MDDADAFLDEPHRHEAAPRGASRAVEFLRPFRLLSNVEDLGGLGLHSEGGLHGLNRAVELGVLLELASEVTPVQLFEEASELASTAPGLREPHSRGSFNNLSLLHTRTTRTRLVSRRYTIRNGG